MASLQELQDALRNADAAGDTVAANRLADAIAAMTAKAAPPSAADAADAGNWDIPSEAVDMLTMGLANKGAAALRGVIDTAIDGGTYSDNYNRQLAKLRGQQESYGEVHPVRKRVGQGIGLGMAMSFPTIKATGGATTAGRVTNAATTGAGYGAVGGAAEDADSLSERAGNIAKGAGYGAGLGAAAYPLAVGAGKVANKSWEWLARQFSSNIPSSTQRQAVATMLKQMQAAGMTPRQAWLKLQELGPEGMLADISPNMQTTLAGATLNSPKAQTLAADRLAARREGGHARVNADLDATMGPPRDPYTVKGDARSAQSATSQAYRSAEQYEVDTAPVADFVQQEILKVGPRGPWGSALQEIRSFIVDDAGNLVSNGARVHAIREQLDIMAESAANSGNKKLASKIGEVRRLVDRSLKEGVPGFANADRLYASEARKVERFEEGRQKVLTKKMTPEEVKAIMDNPDIPLPEKQMLVAGSRWNIAENLSNSRNNPGIAVDRIMTRNMNEPKIEALVGSRGAADRLGKAAEREATFTETSNLVEPSRNSRTMIGQAAKEQFGDPSKPSMFHDVAIGTVGGSAGGLYGAAAGAGAGAIRNVTVRLSNMLKGRNNEAVINRTADLMTSIDPNIQGAVLDEMERQLARIPVRNRTEKTITRILNAAVAQVSARAAPQLPSPAGLLPAH